MPHAFLTLHTGVGTFRPVSAERITDHVMHAERFAIDAATAERINSAERVIAVGTTVTRVLESLRPETPGLRIQPGDHRGETSISIRPNGYRRSTAC